MGGKFYDAGLNIFNMGKTLCQSPVTILALLTHCQKRIVHNTITTRPGNSCVSLYPSSQNIFELAEYCRKVTALLSRIPSDRFLDRKSP